MRPSSPATAVALVVHLQPPASIVPYHTRYFDQPGIPFGWPRDLNSSNRPVRARMLRWRGRGRGARAPMPIKAVCAPTQTPVGAELAFPVAFAEICLSNGRSRPGTFSITNAP